MKKRYKVICISNGVEVFNGFLEECTKFYKNNKLKYIKEGERLIILDSNVT